MFGTVWRSQKRRGVCVGDIKWIYAPDGTGMERLQAPGSAQRSGHSAMLRHAVQAPCSIDRCSELRERASVSALTCCCSARSGSSASLSCAVTGPDRSGTVWPPPAFASGPPRSRCLVLPPRYSSVVTAASCRWLVCTCSCGWPGILQAVGMLARCARMVGGVQCMHRHAAVASRLSRRSTIGAAHGFTSLATASRKVVQVRMEAPYVSSLVRAAGPRLVRQFASLCPLARSGNTR